MNPQPRITAREWRWAVTWALALVVLSGVPYLIAWLSAPVGWHFAGLLANPQDGQTYLAKMQQGLDGNWLFHLTYTPEPHQGALTFTFYLALGHVARLTSLSKPVVFHAARMLTGFVMLITIFRFVAHVTPEPKERRLAFVLVMVASGLGWLGLIFGAFPIDLWIPEAFVPYSLYANPHFPLTIALMVLIFDEALRAEPSIRGIGLVGLYALLLALVLPFVLVTVWVVLLVFAVWRYLTRRLPLSQIWLTLSAIALPGPVLAYFFWVVRTNPVFAGWSAQNVTPAPPLLDLILGYGLVGFFAAAGGWWVIRQKNNHPGEWLTLLWAVTTIGLVYLPIALQRRLITGLHVPLCLLAAIGLTRWLGTTRLKRRRQQQIILLVVTISALGTLVVWSLPLLAARQSPATAYASSLIFVRDDELAALNWLRENAPPDSVVLASPRVGMFIPAQTGARTYYGHPFETIDAETKKTEAEAFFRGALKSPPPPVDFVFYGPTERALGHPKILDQLPVVYTNNSVTIYRTIR